jgi:hypothetical protein
VTSGDAFIFWIVGYLTILLLVVCHDIYTEDAVQFDHMFPSAIAGVFWPFLLPLIVVVALIAGAAWLLIVKPVRSLPGSARRKKLGQ